MINIPVEWFIGVVFALIILVAFHDRYAAWRRDSERRKFYKRMKERKPYED
jgi:hypothetical protein